MLGRPRSRLIRKISIFVSMKLVLFVAALTFFAACDGNFKPISEDSRRDPSGVAGELPSSSSEEENLSSSSSAITLAISSSSRASSSSVAPSSSSIAYSSSSLQPSAQSSSLAPSSSSQLTCGSRTETFDANLYECEKSGDYYWISLRGGVNFAGTNYNAVLIGDQTWMAENVKFDVEGSKCHGAESCAVYGRLYNYTMAMGVCPAGWSLPTKADWEVLQQKVSSNRTRLLYTGTNDFGFSATLGGQMSSAGVPSYLSTQGIWWTATEVPSQTYNAYRFIISKDGTPGMETSDVVKNYFFSVRCIKSNKSN